MKITAVSKFGTLTFNENGGCHIEGWYITTDDPTNERVPTADELAIMLFEFLAERTRKHVLASACVGLSTAVN